MSDPLPYFLLSSHFLRLAENASSRLVGTRNTLTVAADKEISPDEYMSKTKWSDHSIGVAVLFNFYHGLELVLKAALIAKGKRKPNHTLTELLKQFDFHYPGSPLSATLQRHISAIDSAAPVGQFLSHNTLTIDSWYQALKYPSLRSCKRITHWTFQYGGHNTVSFWRGIKNSATTVRKQAVELWRAQ